MPVSLADTDTRYYEGLVRTTARMYARGVGVELEDLEQVLRFRVWRALEAYEVGRSQAARRSFVYTCLRNQIKDLVKARVRRNDAGTECYMEDAMLAAGRDAFEGQHLVVEPDGHLDEAVTLPVTVTSDERQVLALVYVGYSLTETALILGVTPKLVGSRMASIRSKMEDWRPDTGPASGGAQIFQLASEAWTLLEAA